MSHENRLHKKYNITYKYILQDIHYISNVQRIFIIVH